MAEIATRVCWGVVAVVWVVERHTERGSHLHIGKVASAREGCGASDRLSLPLPDEYPHYCERVPGFIPGLKLPRRAH